MKRIAAFLFVASAAVSAWAQGPGAGKAVGKFQDVQGLVTVSSGDQLANAADGAPVLEGSRIITTNGGGVTIVFERGCRVTLRANQSLTVHDGDDCAAIIASVQSLGSSVVPTVVAAGSSTGTGLAVAGGALLLIGNIHSNNQVSPN